MTNRRFLYSFVSIFLSLLFYGQNSVVDSLKKKYELENDLVKKSFLAEKMMAAATSYDSAYSLYSKTYKDLGSSNNKFAQGYVTYQIGVIALETAHYDESIDLLNKAVLNFIESNNDTMMAKCYMRIGFDYYTLGDYETSTKTYYNALSVAERANNTTISAWAYNLLGLNFMSQPNPDLKKALEYLLKAIELNEKDGQIGRNMCLALLRAGSVYSKLNDDENAYKYLMRSRDIANKLNAPSLKKWSLEGYAAYLKRKKEFGKAIETQKESLQISKQEGEMPGIIISHRNIAETYMDMKNYESASLHVDSAIITSIQTKIYQTISSVYLLKSKISEHKGDLHSALFYQRRATEIRDSLFSIETSNNINDLEKKYQTQKKEKEILLLNQEKENDAKLKSIYIIALCCAAVLICIIIFSLFKINRSKKMIALQKLETEKQKDLVMEKQKDITDSINYALRIQDAILPPREISKDIFEDSFVLFKQKDIVSGDFYWYQVKNGKNIITAVDCTGHGVPGALMSMLGMTFLNEIVNHLGITKPVAILSDLRDRVKETLKQRGSEGESKDGMDMALISVDSKTLLLEYCGANNPLWIYRPENGSVTFFELEPDKRPVGYFRGLGLPFSNKEFQLKKGDRIYLFTDGFADQFGGPKGKKFKYKQLQGLLAVIAEETMQEQLRILSETFDTWKGSLEQVDDVCVIGLKV